MRRVVHSDGAALLARFAAAPPATADDVSRTWDGRPLDTKEAILEYLAEVEAIRADAVDDGAGPG